MQREKTVLPHKRVSIKDGEQAYGKWRDSLRADPEFQKKYQGEAAKKALWSQLAKEIQPFLPQEMAAPFPLPRLKKLKKVKAKRARGKRIHRWVVVCSMLTIIAVVLFSAANGESGAWLADAMRAVLGPTITAQVESWYLGFSDTTRQVQYQMSGSHVDAPWAAGKTMTMPTALVPLKKLHLASMPLSRLTPLVTPALSGEGVWLTQETAPVPYNYMPVDAKTFIRPDPSHPYAIVTLLQFDARFFRLHMVAGTIEPGGPRGMNGPGVIPSRDQQANALLAAFNGGFKYADGQYGLKVNSITYVPPQPQAATIAVTREGQIILGAWALIRISLAGILTLWHGDKMPRCLLTTGRSIHSPRMEPHGVAPS